MKIFVLRERVDYHNNDPQDNTFLFSNGETAARELSRLYNEAEEFFTDDGWCEIEETGTTDGKNGQFFLTDRDDIYQVWIEEIELNNQ